MKTAGSDRPRPEELTAHFFDAFALTYDDWFHGLHRRVARRLVELARPRPGEACLDVGCGTGLATSAMAEAVGPSGTVVGLDVSEEMLNLAEARAPANTTYHNVSADPALAFRDASFDLVVFCDSLAYLASPFSALDEARRVLRPGGRVALALRCRSIDTVGQELFFRMLDRLREDHPVMIPQRRDSRGLLGEPQVIGQVLRDAGFREVWTNALVTGDRADGPAAWLDFMAWTGPRPYALITTLVPRQRRRLENDIQCLMDPLGDEAFRHLHAFTFAGAHL